MAKSSLSTPNDGAETGLLARCERFALAFLLLGAPVAFATGLSTFDRAKLIALVIAGGTITIAWLVRFGAAKTPRRLGGGRLALLFWLFILYGAASLLWSSSSTAGWNRLLLLICFFGIVVSAASQNRHRWNWVLIPMAIGTSVVALGAIASHFGVAFPPAIPTGMAAGEGASGFFDHPHFAASYLAIAVPGALYLAAWSKESLPRNIGLVAAILGAFACGLGGGLGVLVLGVVLVLGTLASGRSLQTVEKKRAILVWALAVLALCGLMAGHLVSESASPDAEQEVAPFDSVTKWFEKHQIPHWENVVTDGAEWSFERSRVFDLRSESRWTGDGIGSWQRNAGKALSADDPYYSRGHENHIHLTPPGVLLGMYAELGLIGVLLLMWLSFSVIFATGRGISDEDPGSGFLAAAVLGAVVLLCATSSGYHAGELAVSAVVIGLALSNDRRRSGVFAPAMIPGTNTTIARVERWALVTAPALVLIGLSLPAFLNETRSDLEFQRGVVFMQADQYEVGLAAFERAASISSDNPFAQYHLGFSRYFLPDDEGRREEARVAMSQAARLWPTDTRVLLFSIKVGGGPGQDFEQGIATTRGDINRLRAMLPLDPANAELYHLLADAAIVLTDYDSAASSLAEGLAAVRSDAERGELNFQLGQLFENQFEDPERALRYYREAMSLFPPSSSRGRRSNERSAVMEIWLETGRKPEEH